MRIAHIAPLSYTPGALEYASFIRGGTGADYHQNPEFFQYASGDVIMHWNTYDFDECSNDTVRLYSVSRDLGLNWTDPQVYTADRPGGSPYFILMLGLKGGAEVLTVLVRTVMHEIGVDQSRRVATAGSDYFKSRSRVYVRRSTDGGRLFDHGSELPYEEITGGKVLPEVGFYGSVDNLIQLESGRVVAAFTFMDPSRSDPRSGRQHYTGVCLLSADGGRSWRRSDEIVADTDRGVMEPQIVETSPDRLFCLFRTKGGYLYQTVSEDGGATWRIPGPSPLPSPESMPRMVKLQSGNILTVWNNVSSVTQHPRHPLVASLSSDGGRTWRTPRVIRNETGTNQLSNHNVIQLDDGRILVGISHYHDTRPMTSDLDMALFDEQWALHG
jgi:hypothetical protein